MEARSSSDGGCGNASGRGAEGRLMIMLTKGWMVETKRRYLDCIAEVRN